MAVPSLGPARLARVALPAGDPPDNLVETTQFEPADAPEGALRNGTAMNSFYTYRAEWLDNIRGDLLSGLVVALALIPEAIAFSIIAGVDPKVGLYASFCIAVVIAFVGGRPGMISAATGAMALLMVTLVKNHG